MWVDLFNVTTVTLSLISWFDVSNNAVFWFIVPVCYWSCFLFFLFLFYNFLQCILVVFTFLHKLTPESAFLPTYPALCPLLLSPLISYQLCFVLFMYPWKCDFPLECGQWHKKSQLSLWRCFLFLCAAILLFSFENYKMLIQSMSKALLKNSIILRVEMSYFNR